jgi:hypothetical protein
MLLRRIKQMHHRLVIQDHLEVQELLAQVGIPEAQETLEQLEPRHLALAKILQVERVAMVATLETVEPAGQAVVLEPGVLAGGPED